MANDLKSRLDLIDYLPTTLCADLDTQIQAVIDENVNAVSEASERTVAILGDLASIL